MKYLNRSSATNFTALTISAQPGLWTHLASSKDTLSCNLVYNQVAKNISFLTFNNTANSFVLSANIALSSLNTTITDSQLSSLVVGEYCKSISFMNQIYNVQSTKLVVRPTLSNIQAFSSDFGYIVANNALLSYSSASNSYITLMNLTSYTKYNVVSLDNHIIVWGSSYQTSNLKYSVTQTVYALLDQSGVAKPILTKVITAFNHKTT